MTDPKPLSAEELSETDLTLDERAAKALGWEKALRPPNAPLRREMWRPPGGEYQRLPNFATSIDAQKPLEEMARAQGWYLSSVLELANGEFMAIWAHLSGGARRAITPTEPEARLACLLKVLEARDD